MKRILHTTIAATLTLSGALASAQEKGGTQIGSGNLNIRCRADISAMSERIANIIVEVTTVDNKSSAMVNGAIGNRDLVPQEFSVSEKAFTIDLRSDAVDTELNDGEKRISHIFNLMTDATTAPFLKPLSFDLRKTAKVRLLDLQGNSDKDRFGGTVLVEVIDASGTMLGRFVSTVFPAECK